MEKQKLPFVVRLILWCIAVPLVVWFCLLFIAFVVWPIICAWR